MVFRAPNKALLSILRRIGKWQLWINIENSCARLGYSTNQNFHILSDGTRTTPRTASVLSVLFTFIEQMELKCVNFCIFCH